MRELMSYLPENYPASRETAAFQAALQPEAELIWKARDDLLAQLNPYTADWGLDYWESGLGLPNGRGVDPDIRRRAIAAKLQGRAATTPEVVKMVAETLLGVEVTVAEAFGEYTVLLSTPAGYLPGAGAVRLKAQMRDIMPAHLDFQLVIPAAVFLPVSQRLGPRCGEAALPPPPKRGLSVILPASPLLGVASSTVTLPMAAGKGDAPWVTTVR